MNNWYRDVLVGQIAARHGWEMLPNNDVDPIIGLLRKDGSIFRAVRISKDRAIIPEELWGEVFVATWYEGFVDAMGLRFAGSRRGDET